MTIRYVQSRSACPDAHIFLQGTGWQPVGSGLPSSGFLNFLNFFFFFLQSLWISFIIRKKQYSYF